MTFHCRCGVPERECDFPNCAPDKAIMTQPTHNLRLEKSNDCWVLCGNILPVECITLGQRWQGSSGSIVIVRKVAGDQIHYLQSDGTTHSKDSFSFQCRYSLVAVEYGYTININGTPAYLQIEFLERRNSSLEADLDDCGDDLAQAKRHIETLKAEVERLREQVEYSSRNAAMSQEEAAAHLDRVTALMDKNTRLEKENERLNADFEREYAEVEHLNECIELLQARIDAIMLEYCPDEMTDEQKHAWAEKQARGE